MYRAFFALVVFLAVVSFSRGQDIIYTFDGETIEAVVVDITPGVVKYRKFDRPGGPVFSMALSRVEKVVYEGGRTVVFAKPAEKEEIAVHEEALPPARPSPVFGWHLGFGASDLYGDISGNRMQLASAVGVSFTLPLGQKNAVMFEADILSLGCRFGDMDITFSDGSRLEISDANEDLGYIGLLVTDRYFFDGKRRFYIEGGVYGAFLMSAVSSGDAVITDTAGVVTSGAFEDDLLDLYRAYDLGLAAGLGARIPLDRKGKWHLTAGARFNYGLTNIADIGLPGFEGYRESNIFGLLFVGVDLPTRSSQENIY